MDSSDVICNSCTTELNSSNVWLLPVAPAPRTIMMTLKLMQLNRLQIATSRLYGKGDQPQ